MKQTETTNRRRRSRQFGPTTLRHIILFFIHLFKTGNLANTQTWDEKKRKTI